jgi:hypothetical protein
MFLYGLSKKVSHYSTYVIHVTYAGRPDHQYRNISPPTVDNGAYKIYKDPFQGPCHYLTAVEAYPSVLSQFGPLTIWTDLHKGRYLFSHI